MSNGSTTPSAGDETRSRLIPDVHGFAAFRIAGVDPLEFVRGLGRALNPIRDRLDAAVLAQRATDHIDAAWFANPAASAARHDGLRGVPLIDALFGFETEQELMIPDHFGHDPHRFELSIGPDRDADAVIAIARFDAYAYLDALAAQPGCVPLIGTGPGQPAPPAWFDDTVSRQRVLRGLAEPSEVMLSWKLRNSPSEGMFELFLDGVSPQITQQVPSAPERAKSVLRTALLRALDPTWDNLLEALRISSSMADSEHHQLLRLGLPRIDARTLSTEFVPDTEATSRRKDEIQAIVATLSDRARMELMP